MLSRSFLILLLLTVLSVVAAGAAVYVRQSQARLPDVPAALFPNLVDRVNDVATLRVVSPEGSYTIQRGDGEGWSMKEKYGYPVAFETVKQAVVGVSSLKPLEAKTAKPARFHKVNLNDPVKMPEADGRGTLVSLLDAEGAPIAAVIIGKTRSVKTTDRPGWYYVRKPEEMQTWLASGRIDAYEAFVRWLDSEIVTVARDRIRAASTVQPDGATVNISRPSPEQTDFVLDDIPEGAKLIHETIPNALGSALGFLNFDDVKPREEVDFEGSILATFRTFDGLVVDVRVAKKGEKEQKAWIHFAARFDPDGVQLDKVPEARMQRMKTAEQVAQEVERINSRFGPWAYFVPKYKVTDLTKDIDDFVHFEKSGG